MNGGQNDSRSNGWGALEPYAQIIRSLLPRTATVAFFDPQGKLQWASDSTLPPELPGIVDDTLYSARTEMLATGLLRMLDGAQPVYLCWVRSDDGQLLCILAIACRPCGAQSDPQPFAFVHSMIRPLLECLRRDLLARAAIRSLHQTVRELDKDLELLLDAGDLSTTASNSTDDLRGLLQTAIDHLKCATAALLIPDKGIVLVRSANGGTPDSQLLACTHRQLMSMAQMRREPAIINRVAPNPTLGVIPYRILSCPVRQASGRTTGVLALFRDQDANEFVERDARLAEILARKAANIIDSSYDSLSGLLTRSAFEQRVSAALAGAGNTRWSVLYIDADQLHAINDNFGMHVGDRVLGQFGELIRKRLPPGAVAARISGDRFAIMLPSAVEDAADFAEALRSGAAQLGANDPATHVHVSVSIGVAPVSPDAQGFMRSLAAAETACKAAKDRGRNRVEAYQDNDASIVRRFADINMAARLREAINADRLRLDAQLILPFNNHGRPHFELLVRMIGEDGRTQGPDSFLSAANRYQLMPMIDRWVIRHAIEQLRPHAELLRECPAVFAINFSGQSLNDESFDEFLLDSVRSSGLPPGVFCFELTESATVANLTRAEVLMRGLRTLGCGIALDDFGTGLSSLAYLRQLPVTLLKIDGSFVREILTDVRSESMVKAIAQLARSMSIGTVAEYVETEEIRTRIAALGVDYGQGFAIGRPEPFADVLTQLPVLASVTGVCFPQDEPPDEPRVVNFE